MNIYNASLSYSDRSNESDLAVVQKIQSQLDCISLNLDPKYGDALLRYREALKENERLHKELINKDNELNACVKNLAELAYQNIKLEQHKESYYLRKAEQSNYISTIKAKVEFSQKYS